MPQWIVIIPPELSGQRVDHALAQAGALSRNAIQKLILQNKITLNGKTARKNDRVTEGQTAAVTLEEPRGCGAEPEAIALDIVYEDGDLIVINKPRGLVVHPSPGHESGTLVNALLHHCAGSLSGIGGVARPGIVHRIDKDTSGLIVCAKSDFAHAALSEALRKHEVSRVYECVVRGAPKNDEFTISLSLGRHPLHRKKQAVLPEGRAAVTHVKMLAGYRGYSHLSCRLETGRTHQIRVHLAHLGHPLLGDVLYGGKAEFGLTGQCLHARRLSFIHPRNGGEMEFVTALPEYFENVLKSLGKNSAD